MRQPNDDNQDRRLRLGSLFSGYGGLDLAVEDVFDGDTVWFSEFNPAPARVFAHHWPGVPNLGEITTIDWRQVEPVDVICGGFPCQDVSTVGRMAGLRPGTRSGLWARMAEAIEVLQPEWVVAENVRGLLSAAATRPTLEGDKADGRNPATATPEPATPFQGGAVRGVESDPWHLGDQPARPLRALGAVLGDLADLGYDTRWLGVPASDIGAPHTRFRIFILARRTIPDPTGLRSRPRRESLDRVRARRGTIALSHQVIDLALNGPAGSWRAREPELLWPLIGQFFDAGDATPWQSNDGNTSPDE